MKATTRCWSPSFTANSACPCPPTRPPHPRPTFRRTRRRRVLCPNANVTSARFGNRLLPLSSSHCAGVPLRLGSPHDSVDFGPARGHPVPVVPLVERLFLFERKRFGGGERPQLSGRPQPPGRLEFHGRHRGLRESPRGQPAFGGGAPRARPDLLPEHHHELGEGDLSF